MQTCGVKSVCREGVTYSRGDAVNSAVMTWIVTMLPTPDGKMRAPALEPGRTGFEFQFCHPVAV